MTIDLKTLRLERTTLRHYEPDTEWPDQGLWHMPGLTSPEDEWWDAVLLDERDPDALTWTPRNLHAAKTFFERVLGGHDYDVADWTEAEPGVYRPTLTRDEHEVAYWTIVHDCHTVHYLSKAAFERDLAKVGRLGQFISGPILDQRGGTKKGRTFRLPGKAVVYVEVQVETKPVN